MQPEKSTNIYTCKFVLSETMLCLTQFIGENNIWDTKIVLSLDQLWNINFKNVFDVTDFY